MFIGYPGVIDVWPVVSLEKRKTHHSEKEDSANYGVT
jgi:hypothetical protein